MSKLYVPPLEETKNGLRSSHERLVVVNDYIQKHLKHTAPKVPTVRNVPVRWGFIRLHYWTGSLAKLDKVGDIQAICTGVRSLLEIAVDMVLLHHDLTEESGNRLNAWVYSAQLKHIKLSQDFVRRRDSIPAAEPYDSNFMQLHQNTIEQQRKQFWPSKRGNHPERWTGRANLLEDAREADRLMIADIKTYMNESLESFYETTYRRLNWFVHGSGYVGYQYPDYLAQVLYLTSSVGLDACVRLSLLGCHIHIEELDCPATEKPNPLRDLANDLPNFIRVSK